MQSTPYDPEQPEQPEDRRRRAKSAAESVARQVAESSAVRHKDNGEVDVLATIGGWRGLAEALVPGSVFIVVFTVWQELVPALVAALASAAVFTALRLVQRQALTQALAGLVGVVVCALFSGTTGEARGYYVPGFITNAVYGAALVLSILLRWPLMGVVFGYLRGEGTGWRQDRARLRRYAAATWTIVAVFAARMLVQIPLYVAAESDAGALTALGSARLIMGVPLYAMGLWLAWTVSRPVRRAEPA
ncbi:DUF3159 domain-containing protein [Zhihengliuella sp.]|uniref:DUF3159 domain-containing protein n=1 Tax=Zhihengliuella sp. TaxID=1954483 RepID=UPI002811058D|nr:DUF3159 domain-containing protein [Zhihengliuella sp.]